MNNSHRKYDDSELTTLSRRYAAMGDADRAAFCATIDAELACELAYFAKRIGVPWVERSLSDIECGVLAAGLADVFADRPDSELYLGRREVPSAVSSLRNAVAEKGETAHLFMGITLSR